MRRLGSIVVVVTGLVVGCGSPLPTPSSAPSGSGRPSSAPSSASAPATPSSTTDPSGSIVVDEALLDHLPAAIGGIERRSDPETAAQVAADPALGQDAEGLAVALYVAPIPTDTVLDYAVATVARLRPGVMGEDWFRAWRGTFDEGVCLQAGGVDIGHSQFDVDGRTVHRSTCVGGVTIYHTHLPGPDIVVSTQGTGSRELGRALVEGATE